MNYQDSENLKQVSPWVQITLATPKTWQFAKNTLNVSFVFYKQVHHHEFIPMFEKQYPDHRWADVEVSMKRLLNV